MDTKSNAIFNILFRGMLVCSLAVGITLLLPATGSAQSAGDCAGKRDVRCGPAAKANARWAAFWKKFSSAVSRKDGRQFIALSKGFKSAGGETIEQYVEWTDWSELSKSVRKGTERYEPGAPGIIRVTRDRDLLFEYKNGSWNFIGELTA